MDEITIFTPTFNRAHLLKRCYNSLKIQKNSNFIWQIIDDGSTDNTQELVDSFVKEGILKINYIKKINGGKVSAINLSVKLTKTEFWLCLDSDDYLLPNAIKNIQSYLTELRNPKYYGLVSLRCNKNGSPMQGKNFPCGIKSATQYEIRYKYKINPEYAQLYKTNIIKQYEYPICQNEKYVPLSYVPDFLDQSYELLLVREGIMVCEYQEDGITKNQKKIAVSNPEGFKKCMIQRMLIKGNFFFKTRAIITYVVMCIITRDEETLKNSPMKLLTIFLFPVAYLDFLLRYRKYIKR